MEQIEKRGKELEASEKLTIRVMPFVKNYVDLIVGDALYFTLEFFKTTLELGKHLFIKSREDNLDIIKETEVEYQIDLPILREDETYYTEGIDEERGCWFSVFKKRNPYYYKDLPAPLSCYRVEEHYFKSDREKEVFYCITTAKDISLKEAREIAKQRWQIENNVFRNGNQSFNTKRKRLKDDEANRKYLILIYTFLSLLWLLYSYSTNQIYQENKTLNTNFRYFCLNMIITSILIEETNIDSS